MESHHVATHVHAQILALHEQSAARITELEAIRDGSLKESPEAWSEEPSALAATPVSRREAKASVGAAALAKTGGEARDRVGSRTGATAKEDIADAVLFDYTATCHDTGTIFTPGTTLAPTRVKPTVEEEPRQRRRPSSHACAKCESCGNKFRLPPEADAAAEELALLAASPQQAWSPSPPQPSGTTSAMGATSTAAGDASTTGGASTHRTTTRRSQRYCAKCMRSFRQRIGSRAKAFTRPPDERSERAAATALAAAAGYGVVPVPVPVGPGPTQSYRDDLGRGSGPGRLDLSWFPGATAVHSPARNVDGRGHSAGMMSTKAPGPGRAGRWQPAG